MKIIKTKNENLELNLKIIIPNTDIQKDINAKMQELNQSIQINGFRKGKIPPQILKQKYGSNIRKNVVQTKIDDTIKDLEIKEKIQSLTTPKIKILQDQELQDLEFNVEFLLKAKIEIPNLKKITIAQPKIIISHQDITKEIIKSLKQDEVYTKSDQESAEGDIVIISNKAYIDDEFLENLSWNNQKIILGEHSFLPEFENSLKALKKGDEKIIPIQTITQNNAKFSNKIVTNHVKIIEILKPQENFQINPQIAEKLNFKDPETLTTKVKNSIQQYYQNLAYNFMQIKLFDTLESLLNFELPTPILKQEIDAIKSQFEKIAKIEVAEQDLLKNDTSYLHKLEFIKIEHKSEQEKEEYFQKIAARRLRIALFLQEYSSQNKINLSQDEIQKIIFDRISFLPPNQREEMLNLYQKNPQLLNETLTQSVEKKSVEHILTQVILVDTNYSRQSLEHDIQHIHKF